jgi:RimJ/RimL family protein N-acetyltransferase
MTEKEGLVLIRGNAVALRRRTVADIQLFLKWRRMDCQARKFDAPWEQPLSDEEFAAKAVLSIERESSGRITRAVITDSDGQAIGSVNAYGDGGCAESRKVGIAIYEDSRLGRGLGTEALGLWVGHLFAAQALHRVGLETWSFNPRMARVAEKVGFRFEGMEREARFWEGRWLDRLHYGLLAAEWRELERKVRIVGGKPAADQ